MKVFDFKEQLIKGSEGEALFLSYYSDLKQLDGRKGDFIGKTGRIIELKTDSRSTKDSPNFFMELERNDKGDAGGPFQALDNKVYYFCYMFSDGIVYWFETSTLVEFLLANLDNFERRRIMNKGWTAVGLLVPRAEVEFLMIKKESLFDKDGTTERGTNE